MNTVQSLEAKYARVFYQTEFLYNFSRSVFHAVYTVFLIEAGLAILQVNYLRIAFFATIILFEVPTGVVADKFSRKVSMLSSAVMLLLGYVVYYFFHSYEAFFVAVCFTGVGFTLYSGALEAWIVDTLKHLNSQQDLGLIFSNGNYYRRVGMLAGGTGGSLVAVFDMNSMWLLGIAGMVILIGITITSMHELVPASARKHQEKTNRAQVHALLRSRNIIILFLISVVLFYYNQPNFLYWQVYFEQWFGKTELLAGAADFEIFGYPVKWQFALLGLVFLLNNYLSMQGSAFLKRMYAKNETSKERLWYLGSVLVMGLGYVVMFFAPNLLIACIAYAAVCYATGIYDPIFRKHLNEHIPSSVRATMLSLNTLFSRMGSVLSLLTLGDMASDATVDISFLYGGIIFIALTIPLVMLYYGGRKQEAVARAA